MKFDDLKVGTVKEGCPMIKERLEKEWLEEIGAIPDKGQFHKVTARALCIVTQIVLSM